VAAGIDGGDATRRRGRACRLTANHLLGEEG
jgi:hypothetical protein